MRKAVRKASPGDIIEMVGFCSSCLEKYLEKIKGDKLDIKIS